MKTNIRKIGMAVLAVGICIWSGDVRAQTTTTVTTTKGAFTEFVPGAETVVIRSETSTTPVRYVVTKQTTIVDETGAPVLVERISPGSPLSVEYSTAGDRLVASRIVVQRPAVVTAPVTTAPVTTAPVTTAPVTTAPVTTQQQTTTTTTRTLTHEEKEALKERKEKEIERRKEALDKAKDKLDDDD